MNAQRAKDVSKFLSLVLRHEPQRAGVRLEAAGWVAVSDLIDGCTKAGFPIQLDELWEVVATSDKQRFALSDDGTRIRANQGHSIPVELGYATAQPPEQLFHGTASTNLASIRCDGLHRAQRHHVHLSETPQTAEKVGQRHGKPVVLVVESGRMSRDGYAFYRSANGVWLVDAVPAEYLLFPDDADDD